MRLDVMAGVHADLSATVGLSVTPQDDHAGLRMMPKAEPPRVAVIGAGPIGIEAALYAKACGLPVAVYDRGGIAEHVRRWGHVRLFTPFGLNVTPLGLKTLRAEKPNRTLPAEADILTGREFRDAYLVPLGGVGAAARKPQPRNGRAPRRPRDETVAGSACSSATAKGQERIDTADVVLDCAGTYGTPNWLGDGNIAAVGELAARPHIASGLEDVLGEKKSHYAGAASRSSATATRPRRRSVASRRSRRNTRRRGCSG